MMGLFAIAGVTEGRLSPLDYLKLIRKGNYHLVRNPADEDFGEFTVWREVVE